uniref:Uncharacterized protein n=1 Tax=Oryza brachyantha TaxID=4533 RepID=J3LB93_ORYBR
MPAARRYCRPVSTRCPYTGKVLSLKASGTSALRRDTPPGSSRGSGRARYSPVAAPSCSSTVRLMTDIAARLLGKKMYPGTPSSSATDSAAEQKKSGTSAASRRMDRSISRRCGRQRWTSSISNVSRGVSAGRSSRGNAGSTAVATEAGSEDSTAERAAGAAGSAKGTSAGAARPGCLRTRRASSASGMRWPAPGLASSTTCGRGAGASGRAGVGANGSIDRGVVMPQAPWRRFSIPR